MATSEDKDRFFSLCYKGDVDEVAQLLRQDPNLIKYKHRENGKDKNHYLKNRNRKSNLIECR